MPSDQLRKTPGPGSAPSRWTDVIRPLLVGLFLLLPLLALNFGVGRQAEWTRIWEKRATDERARQVLEHLSQGWTFAWQFSRLSFAFRERVLAVPVGRGEDRNITDLMRQSFRPPFPVHEVWAVRIPPGGKGRPTLLSQTRASRTGRQTIGKVLAFLVGHRLQWERSAQEGAIAEKLLGQMFGGFLLPRVLAGSQKGIPTPLIFQRRPHLLLWDFIDQGEAGVLAWLILVPDGEQAKRAGFLLALRGLDREFQDRAAFIRFFPDGVGNVLPANLRHRPEFARWVRGLARPGRLMELERNGLPWGQVLGGSRLFALTAINSSHFPVLVLPQPAAAHLPRSLFLLNLVVSGGVLLGIFQGILLGRWPALRLGTRFSALYLIAVALPLILLLLSAVFYLQESHESARHDLERQLTSHLKQLEEGKERLEGEYVACFQNLIQDPELIKRLREGGAKAPGLAEFIRRRFQGSFGELPLAMVAVIPPVGSPTRDLAKGIDKNLVESAFGAFMDGSWENLRGHIRVRNPDFPLGTDSRRLVTEISIAGYESSTGNKFLQEIEKERSRPFFFTLGRSQAAFLQDYVVFDGQERYVLFVVFLDTQLDREIIEQGRDQAMDSQPGLQMAAFRDDGTVLQPFLSLPSDAPPGWETRFHEVARSAYARRGAITRESEGIIQVAFPARRFADLVLVAGASLAEIHGNLRHQAGVFGFLFLISLGAAYGFGRLTGGMVVSPIRVLKAALDRVAAGDLSQRMGGGRRDEIGTLEVSFTRMTAGLRERQRLASLVSGEAMAAIERSGDLASGLQVRSLRGVVLVSDIRDFTTLCENEEPARVTRLLNRHFTEMAAVIAGEGGRIHQFIGDAILAIFEEKPSQSCSSAGERAVTAGLAMLDCLEVLNEDRRTLGEPPYRIGLGLAGGDLLAGPIGTPGTRLDFTLLGDAFKRAQELEPLSKGFPECPLVADPALIATTGRFAGRFRPLEGAEGAVLPGAALAAERSRRRAGRAPGESRSAGDSRGGGPAGPPSAVPVEASASGEGFPTGEQKTRSAFSLASRLGPGEPFRTRGSKAQNAGLRATCLVVVGLLWLVIPWMAWRQADTGRLAHLRRTQETEVREAQQASLDRLRGSNAGVNLLEEHLERVVHETARALFAFGHPPGEEECRRFGAQLARRLQQVGYPPDLWVVQPLFGGGASFGLGTTTPDLKRSSGEVASGPSGLSEAAFFRELLLVFGGHYARASVSQGKSLDPGVPRYLGSAVGVWHLLVEGVFHVLPCGRGGRSSWLYWQPILARDGRVLATVLVILPRQGDTENRPHQLLSLLDDRVTRFAFVPRDGEGILRSPKFPVQVVPHLAWDAPLPDPPEWVIGRVEGTGQGSSQIVAATRVGTSLPMSGVQRLSILVGGLVTLLLIRLWWATVMTGEGLALSLRGMLMSGLLAACVLPLSAAFPLVERFPLERLESLKRETRLQLRAGLDEMERRAAMHRPQCWVWLRQISHDPRVVARVNQIIRGRTGGAQQKQGDRARVRLNQWFQKVYGRSKGFFLRSPVGPQRFRMGLDSIRIVTRRGNAWDFPNETEKGKKKGGGFEGVMSVVGKTLLEALGGPDSDEGERAFDMRKAKREMATEIGLKILLTTFGEDVYFRLVNSPGNPVVLMAGSGGVTLFMEVVPDLNHPDYLHCWFYSSQVAEQSAYSRLIGEDNQGLQDALGARYLAWERHWTGQLAIPWIGGHFPGSRGLARRVEISKRPISWRVEGPAGGELVEGRLGQANRNMVLFGYAPEAPLQMAVAGLRSDLLRLFLWTIFGTMLLASTAADDILGPVKALTRAMRRVEDGDFLVRVETQREDELGDLVRAFNALARGLEERELIGRMVSRDAREKVLAADGHGSFGAASVGERREITLLMLGIPGFSARSHDLAPEALFEALTRQTALVCGLCLASGGDVDKVMGDKILTTFSHRDGAVEAVRRLAETLQGVIRVARSGRLPFPLVAGAARGTVISGVLGAGTRCDHTVIGDPVNTAARVMALAEREGPGTILVTDDLAGDLEERVAREPFGVVQVKGKARTLRLFRLFPKELENG